MTRERDFLGKCVTRATKNKEKKHFEKIIQIFLSERMAKPGHTPSRREVLRASLLGGSRHTSKFMGTPSAFPLTSNNLHFR